MKDFATKRESLSGESGAGRPAREVISVGEACEMLRAREHGLARGVRGIARLSREGVGDIIENRAAVVGYIHW